MAHPDPFLQYVLHDLLGHLPNITSRAMFGGYGLYQAGQIFAIIADDKLWFKVGPANQADFEALGSLPFTYMGKNGQPHTMSYWELPSQIIDDPHQIGVWVTKSVNIGSDKQK